MKTTMPRPSSLAALPALLFTFTFAPLVVRAADVYWGGGAGNINDNNWHSSAALNSPVARAAGDVINLASGTVSVTTSATVYDTNIGLGSGNNAAVIVSGTWRNTNGELSIGNDAGSTGALTVLSSGTVRANTFYVGNYGSGTFHLAEGARLTNSANVMFGRNAGGYGTATIHGTWTVHNTTTTGNFTVGYSAGGQGDLLAIGETGSVVVVGNSPSTNYFRVGGALNTSGTAIVNGLLRVESTSAINSIGYSGNNQTAASQAANGVLIIGQSGTVIFSGSESSLGHFGLGSGDAYRANATGTAFVDGVWKNAGNLIVGRSGAGHLEINRTGTVSVGTHLTIAAYNSGSNALGKTTGPQGGTLIVDGLLSVGNHVIIGAGVATATLRITENGTVITGTNGAGNGYVQVGRNGTTAGTGNGTATVPGTATVQVDGLFDIRGNFHLGQRSTSEVTIGEEGTILVSGNYHQTPQSLLAITPGATSDLPALAIAGAANISGTLKIANIDALAGYASAATAANSSALPFITVLSAGAGINDDFQTVSVTPALTGATGLPDYIYNGKTILENAGAAAEYRVGQLLAWHAPAANAHGTFTIGAGNTFTLDTPLADRADAASFTTGWDGKSLSKKGPGTLVLAASDTRTGDTIIESGTLRAAADALSLGNLVNNAVLDLGGATATGFHTATAATLAGSGTLIFAIDPDTGVGDRLIITGNAHGAHTVRVSINGVQNAPTSAQLAAIITIDGSNNATFNDATPPALTVTFAPQGGSVSPISKTISPNNAYGELPTPVRAGDTFAGWFTAPSGGTQVTDTTIVASDATSHILYARWIAGGHPVITPDAGIDLYGSIIDETGAPIPGVVVSDGFQCVKTDANGIYQMTRNAKARVVYYSTPENYAINTSNATGTGLAKFHTKLTSGRQRYNFDLVKLPAPETDFILLGVGDPQVTSLAQLKRYETETIADIAKFRQTTTLPVYAVLLGDIVGDHLYLHGPTRDTTDLAGIPYFSVIGNHDHNQAFSNYNKDYESGEDYENIYGPLNYSFNRGNVHIIGLDNVLYTRQSGYGTGLTSDILEWVRQDLSFVPETKTIIIAYHIPLRGGTYQNAQNLFNLLKDYADVHFIAGHTHYQQNIRFTITGSTKTITAHEHIHGGACGAWWASIINTDGAPNGYGVYTLSGTTMADWYYKPTGYSDTYQMRMYRGNASFGVTGATYTYNRNANDVVVDAWNADSNWNFAVYENGVKVSGSLAKLSTRVDAYAAGYHVGVLGRAAGGNYDSSNNNHLYYHTLANANARVEIRATDSFGKTYTLSDFTTDLSEFPAEFSSPAITAQPQDAIVTAGQSVTFAATVTGAPVPAVKWQSSSDGTTWTDVPGAASASYTITNATTALGGTQYRLAANNIRGLATSASALLTVNADPAFDAAQALKTQLEAPGTATITVTGTVDLSLVGGATVASGKTITGADANATIIGSLTVAAGADDSIIRGLNFTGGALVINGANDVVVTHCTFTDAPVSITGGSDNIAFSWNKFTATPAGTGSAMTISNAGASTGIILHHNLWGDGLKNDMPAVTNARVLMFNNHIAATGNTSATIAGAGAQILSVRNLYKEGVNNPIATQSTGLVCTIGNSTNATISSSAANVFVPGYSYVMNTDYNDAANLITIHAGNTAGQASTTPGIIDATASITATVSGSGATSNDSGASVPSGGGFTLTANAAGVAPVSRQWYRNNFAITGATNGTYAVANASAANAGTYSVALTTTTGEIVTSGAFTMTVGTLAAPAITAHPASKTINVGDSVTFTVVATGENLGYQWMKGGVNINGATSASYTITNAQQSRAGGYSVRVSNSTDFVTSNTATLTVNAASGGGGGGGGGAPSLFLLPALAVIFALRKFSRRSGVQPPAQ